MSGHDDAPAIKLYGNKKEQERFENFAGMLSHARKSESLYPKHDMHSCLGPRFSWMYPCNLVLYMASC